MPNAILNADCFKVIRLVIFGAALSSIQSSRMLLLQVSSGVI